MNIRLDYINKFHPGTVERMTELRKKFMALDTELVKILGGDEHPENVDSPLLRTVANARTRLEEASMHAIKSLCLRYEVKEEYVAAKEKMATEQEEIRG